MAVVSLRAVAHPPPPPPLLCLLFPLLCLWDAIGQARRRAPGRFRVLGRRCRLSGTARRPPPPGLFGPCARAAVLAGAALSRAAPAAPSSDIFCLTAVIQRRQVCTYVYYRYSAVDTYGIY